MEYVQLTFMDADEESLHTRLERLANRLVELWHWRASSAGFQKNLQDTYEDVTTIAFPDTETTTIWSKFMFIVQTRVAETRVLNNSRYDVVDYLSLFDRVMRFDDELLAVMGASKFMEIFNAPVVDWNLDHCSRASGLFANAQSFAGRFSENFVKRFAAYVLPQTRKRVVGLLAGAPYASSEALLTEYELVLKHETMRGKQLLRTARRGAMGADSRVVSSYRCFTTRRPRRGRGGTNENMHCHWTKSQYTTLLLGLRFLDGQTNLLLLLLQTEEVGQRIEALVKFFVFAAPETETEKKPPPPPLVLEDDDAPKKLLRTALPEHRYRPGPRTEPDMTSWYRRLRNYAADSVADPVLLNALHWLTMVAVRMTLNREGVLRLEKEIEKESEKETETERFRRLSRAARVSHGRRVYGLYLLSEFRKRLTPAVTLPSRDENDYAKVVVTDHVFHVLLADHVRGNRDYEFVFGKIGDWDVTHVTDMSGAFEGWPVFDEDLSRWVVGPDVSTTGMFRGVGIRAGKLGNGRLKDAADAVALSVGEVRHT